MLEAVVEHDGGGAPGGCGAGGRHAVAVGDMRNARHDDRQFGRLVAHLAGADAVAATHDRRSVPGSLERAGHPGHERRLACAAEREVADRDHRHRSAVNRGQAAVVGCIAGGDDAAVRHGDDGQRGPDRRRAGAAHGAIDEAFERVGVGQERHEAARGLRSGWLNAATIPVVSRGRRPGMPI